MSKTKKYNLHNSYFKVNGTLGLPDTILEIGKHWQEHKELPFKYDGENWVYDAFCERQKYRGVHKSQFLTPDAKAKCIAHIAATYFRGDTILEPCCGTGQITKEFKIYSYRLIAFDRDLELVGFLKLMFPMLDVFQSDFREVSFVAN